MALCLVVIGFTGGGNAILAQKFTVGNLKYEILFNSSYVVVYDFKSSGMPSTLTIPATVEYQNQTYEVCEIANFDPGSSVWSSGVNSLVGINCDTLNIGPGITRIGRGSVQSNHLKKINFGSSVESIYIGGCAYNRNAIGTLVLPNSLKYIHEGAFREYGKNGNLTGDLVIPANVEYIGRDAFREVPIPGRLIFAGYNLTEISTRAFMDCSEFTGALELPLFIYSIGECAFEGCGFTSITMGDYVRRIAHRAFYGCVLVNNLTLGRDVTEIGAEAFAENVCLQNVSIHATTPPTLGENAFLNVGNAYSGCTLTVPDGCASAYLSSDWNNYFTSIVEEHGNAQMFNNNGLTYRVNPDGNTVTVTGPAEGSTVPTVLNLGGNVTHSGHQYQVTAVGNNAFEGKQNIVNVLFDNSIEEIGDGAFTWCMGLTGVIWPQNLRRIGAYAFGACTSFQAETIPNTVEYIGKQAFWGAHVNFQLPASLKYIGEQAFYNNTYLTSLTLPNSLEYIGNGAFYGCSNITGNLTIPTNVWYIGDSAFEGCSGLTGALNIPYSVWYIGERAFRDCSGITDVNTPIQYQEVRNLTFADCSSLQTWNGSQGWVTRIEYGAFKASGLAGTFNTGNSTTFIGEEAFYNCQNISELIIGLSVDTIRNGAFANCTGITTVRSLAAEPPYLENNVNFKPFKDVPCTTLIVPCGSRAAYEASGWAEHFTTITENCSTFDYEDIIYQQTGDGICMAVSPVTDPQSYDAIYLPEPFENYAGDHYEITKISNRAFEGYYNIHGTLTIPSTVERIEYFAFRNCTGYEGGTLVLGESVNWIGEEAFYNTGFSTVISLRADKAPWIDYDAFNNYDAIAVVPCGCMEMYMDSEWSNYFTEIIEDCQYVEMQQAKVNANIYPNPTSGIVKIEAENLKNVEIFNMMGQKVFEAPVSGDEFEYNFNGSTGMFMIRVEMANGVETKRVVVM